MKALDRNRDKRFETASDLGDALEKAARDAGWLGNHKDVATHLESVLGTDISAQRDAVRSWLARSEPSQRFEGKMLQPPVSQPSVPKDAETKVAEGAPGVSSVSSAIIQVPGAAGQPVPSTVPPRKRSRAWIVAAGLAVLLLTGGLFAAQAMRKSIPTVAATQPPPPTATLITPTATTPVTPVMQPITTATDETATVAVAPTHVVTHGGISKVGGHGTVKPTSTATSANTTVTPTPTSTSAATVDDISKNPYR